VLELEYLLRSATFIVIYGVSYGMVLYLISIGLILTMGLMRVVNLAHGAFAAMGGYICVYLMTAYAIPFALAVIAATVLVAAVSIVVERGLYTRIYTASELDQVLMTVGLLFIAVAALNFFFGPNVLPAKLPAFLDENVEMAGRMVQVYRLFVAALGALIVLGLWLVFEKTSFGAQLRAAVDNRSMAEAVGIDVRRLYSLAFALGSGLAALGGAAGYGMLPLEPLYPFKYLTLIMMIVALSGFGNMKNAAFVAIAVGLVDTAGRYLFPAYGAFFIYAFLMIVLLTRMQGGFFRRRA
jgi:branched-chain amino acid transport system permease protein